MKSVKFFIAAAFSALLLQAAPAGGQDKVTKAVIQAGTNDNRVMELEDFLANRIGGRPVGSHSLEDAEKWVEKQLRSWGLEVMVQEVGEIGVGFSRGPWSGRMLAEDGMVLHFGTPGYSAGTRGPQKGRALLEPKDRKELDRMRGALKGSWVLVNAKSSGFAVNYDDTVHLYREMAEAGVLGFIQPADLPIRVLYDRKGCYKLTMDSLPTVCDIKLDERQFATIRNKLEAREDVTLEFDIRNHFFEGPVKYHNIIGIIRGSKYPDEYVLTGGHLDAYDTASGAIDDAQGTCVTLESARLLALAGAKPKRSIMFTIWTGEEYGLLGSKYFVENRTVPLEKISNYFNRDGGPEVAVGVTVPEAMYDDFVKAAKPLEGLGGDFPFTVSKRKGEPGKRPEKPGGSDYAYFAMNGVPTISLDCRDVKGYNFNYRTIWHTDRDLYDQCIPEYLEHSAMVNAIMVYGLANLDHILSRDGLYK